MPIRDTAAKNASLNNDYGANKGPNAAAAHEVALFTGDPMQGGLEVEATTDTESGTVSNGYARVTVTNDGTTWAAAADGLKLSNGPVEFDATLEEWPLPVTHFALFDAADGTTMWDSCPLMDPLVVTGAGSGPAVLLTVFYDDSITI